MGVCGGRGDGPPGNQAVSKLLRAVELRACWKTVLILGWELRLRTNVKLAERIHSKDAAFSLAFPRLPTLGLRGSLTKAHMTVCLLLFLNAMSFLFWVFEGVFILEVKTKCFKKEELYEGSSFICWCHFLGREETY